MTLSFKVKGVEVAKEVVIPFQPPLSGYEDVKPRLLEMRSKALAGLGMVKTDKSFFSDSHEISCRLQCLKSKLLTFHLEHMPLASLSYLLPT
jgi:hypothetical protein